MGQEKQHWDRPLKDVEHSLDTKGGGGEVRSRTQEVLEASHAGMVPRSGIS